MLRKTSGNTGSPTDQWKAWQKLSRASWLWFSSVGTHRKFGIWRRLRYKNNASIISPQKFWNFLRKKQRLPPTLYDTANRVLSTYSLFLKTLFGIKETQKRGRDEVRAGLLNMSDQEENVGEDCLAHVFWGVLDNSYSHFSNPLTRSSMSEIDGSAKCLASGHQTGSHGWKTGI